VSQTCPSYDGVAWKPRRGSDRATVRYRCAPATIGKLYAGEDHELQHAWVMNLSRTGMGFVVPRPLMPGLFIVVQVRGTATARVYELSAQVVHCTVGLQGEWTVGCAFAEPLSHEVLDNLL
jgi:PilZ domain